MRHFRVTICLSIVWLLVNLSLAGSSSGQTKRPSVKNSQPTDKQEKSPEKTKSDQPTTIKSYPDLGPEMRIALATDATNVSIGSTGEIDLQDGPTDSGWTVDADTLKFRVQSPQTIIARGPGRSTYHVHVASMMDRSSADRLASKLEKKYGDSVGTEYNSRNKTYDVHAGTFSDEKNAKALQRQLSEDGYRDAEVVPENSATVPKDNPGVRVFYSNGSEVLSAKRTVIVSANTKSHSPLTFNQIPYRGRFEVLLNDKQQLTVVNVLPMEDYIRGVVPMELNVSQIEAVKAQAVAARTYALRNRGQFKNEGFDLLPTPQ